MAGGQSELYFRNHRKAERGGLPQPRSTSFSHRQYPCLGNAETSGLSLDAADVSLQWLVFPWTITLLAGTHVCLRKVNAANIYDSIVKHGVTHLCGAPIVMGMIANAEDQDQRVLSDQVQIMTAAAPPPPPVIARMEEMGFQVTHVYGLTETYGPSVVSAWHEEWNELSPTDQALKKGRQGVKLSLGWKA